MNSNKITQFVWAEKYRPPTIKGMILPDSLKKFFENVEATKNIPHMTLYSPNPGSGKTTAAKALCNGCGIEDYLYINASKDGNIDTIKKDVTQYVTVHSIDGKGKVVIFDEAEGMTIQAQASLKNLIESFSHNCSFIFTTNNISKMNDAILSRCPVQDFNLSDKSIKQEITPKLLVRLKKILEQEKVIYDEVTLKSLIEKFYPDIRKMISRLQTESIKLGSITANVMNDTFDHSSFYEMLLENKINDCRRYLIESGCDYDEMYSNLFREFVPMLEKNPVIQNNCILLVAKYLDMSSRSVDKEITFTACMVDIGNNLKR